MDRKWNDLQLEFSLDLDDVEDDAQDRSISPQEARQISEAARQAIEGQINRGELRNAAGDSLAAWWPEYQHLVEKGWPWRVACYIAWASSPKRDRWPSTLQDLATEVLGLTGPRVIYTWRKKYPAIDTVIAMMQAAPLWEHRRDVIEALVEMAKTPDYKAFNDRKLFLEMIGDYVPRSKLDLNKSGMAEDLSNLSDDELDALLGERKELLTGEEEDTDGDAGPKHY